jgi:D-aminopeptidase
VYSAVWQWVLQRAREKNISSNDVSHNYGTPVVGETADWWLNDVHRSMLDAGHVGQAIRSALTQTEVLEGQHGGGAGMTCHMFPAGTGTSSRVVQGGKEGEIYTVGVLCQSNYGKTYDFQVGGVPIGKLLLEEKILEEKNKVPTGKADDGSIVIILM